MRINIMVTQMRDRLGDANTEMTELFRRHVRGIHGVRMDDGGRRAC